VYVILLLNALPSTSRSFNFEVNVKLIMQKHSRLHRLRHLSLTERKDNSSLELQRVEQKNKSLLEEKEKP